MNTVTTPGFRFRKEHLVHLHPIADRLFETGKFERLEAFFDYLSENEREWTTRGDSDGFFVWSLVKSYAERAIEEGRTDLTSFLLNYQAAHFDEEFTEEAESMALDIAFGLADRAKIYYSRGCMLEFGTWPDTMEADESFAPDSPLLWTVLVQEENRVLLLSRYGIDFLPFHNASQDVTWADCDVRQWLNTDFLDQAFTPEEQARIPAVSVHTPDNLRFSVKGGPDTVDRVFLLSTEEAESLIPDVHSRIRTAAPYAIAAGAVCDAQNRSSWLLRSPGDKWLSTACVAADGCIETAGPFVYQSQCCICPALWMEIPPKDDF